MSSMSLQTTYNSAPAIGYAGMLEGDLDQDIVTMKNAEATASMPFGTAVVFKTASPGTDLDAIVPTASYVLVAGIITHSHEYARQWTDSDGNKHGDLDSVGLVPGAFLNVLRRGKILVFTQQATVPSQRLFVSTATGAGNAYTAAGQLGNADDTTGGGSTTDCTKQGQWLTTAAAGALAWLDVDFTAKP